MTTVITGIDDLAFRKANGLPLYLHGRPVSDEEAQALLAGRNVSQPVKAVSVQPHQVRVAESIASERMAACRVCPMYRQESDRCGMLSCGCSMAERSRSAFASCPNGLWRTQV